MIIFRDTILENYFIDPVTAVITNSKGEVQEISIHKDGRLFFKSMAIHQIQIHTHLGYKKGFDIHHLDGNKMNNSLSNLVYLTKSEHTKLHNKGNKYFFGKSHSSETKQKMSEAKKGEKNPLYGKQLSEETKRKMSESHKGLQCEAKKGEKHPMFGKKYKFVNNGVENRFIHFDEDIPEGFIRGRLKRN